MMNRQPGHLFQYTPEPESDAPEACILCLVENDKELARYAKELAACCEVLEKRVQALEQKLSQDDFKRRWDELQKKIEEKAAAEKA